MLLSWISWPFRNCYALASTGPPPPPAQQQIVSQQECWNTLAEINDEAAYRWSLGQSETLSADGHRDRVYDALWNLVRHHGATLTYLENKLRALGYQNIWLYPLPHDNDSESVLTICRDPLTREPRPFSVGLFLGPESEFMPIKRDLAGAGQSGTLAECGFLEMK